MRSEIAKEYLHIELWLKQIAIYTESGIAAYSDPLVQDACDALLMRIGEASNRLSKHHETDPDSVLWRLVVDMRNWLIHGYDVIDRDLVWSTITSTPPKLLDDLKGRISEAHNVIGV